MNESYDSVMARLMDVHSGYAELQNHPELADFLLNAFRVAIDDNDNLLEVAEMNLSDREYKRLLNMISGTKNQRYAALYETMKKKGLTYSIMVDTLTTHHEGLQNQFGGGVDNSGDVDSNNRRQNITNITNNKSSKNCVIL